MYNQWKRFISRKFDDLDIRYDYDEDENRIITILNGHVLLIEFFNNGINTMTGSNRGIKMNRYNKADCLEFINLYNAAHRFPSLAFLDDGTFFTRYWLGIGEDDEITNDAWRNLLAGSCMLFVKGNGSSHSIEDAMSDVCNGIKTPQEAIEMID